MQSRVLFAKLFPRVTFPVYGILRTYSCNYLHANLHKSTVTHDSSIDQLFKEQLVEFPAILGSLFHKVVNTISTPIGVEGGGGG